MCCSLSLEDSILANVCTDRVSEYGDGGIRRVLRYVWEKGKDRCQVNKRVVIKQAIGQAAETLWH